MTRGTEAEVEWFLTAPDGALSERRGDPLGFRAIAERYADLLAPGLTNRTWDARWLTILCWCMQEVEESRRVLGVGKGLQGAALRRHVYEWIRPLELAWVAQATRSLTDQLRVGRQLPQRTAIGANEHHWARQHFGLNDDQYRRYRFVGPHGAYRTLLGSLPGLSAGGDGHRPGDVAKALARLVAAKVPAVRRHARRAGRPPSPEQHWEKSWSPARRRSAATLGAWWPTSSRVVPTLTAKERQRLAPLLFDLGPQAKRRRRVAQLALASSATTIPALCRDLAAGLKPGASRAEGELLTRLPAFKRFADAGIRAMNRVWWVLREDGQRGPWRKLDTLVGRDDVAAALLELRSEGARWRGKRGRAVSSSFKSVDALAAAVCAGSGSDKKVARTVLRALLDHHLANGGGRRWFREGPGKLAAELEGGAGGAAFYSFRLWSLARLAFQLGVTDDMPDALNDLTQAEVEE